MAAELLVLRHEGGRDPTTSGTSTGSSVVRDAYLQMMAGRLPPAVAERYLRDAVSALRTNGLITEWEGR